jgi:transposase InsO family protein
MKNCTVLAAFIKNRKAGQQEKASINLVNNFEGSSSDEEFVESETNLGVNLAELNLVDNNKFSKKEDWYVDSGASKHVTGLKNLLSELEEGCRSRVSTAGGDTLNVAGKGKVDFSTVSGGIQFDDVLYVPGITKNLLSVGAIADGRSKPKILFDSNHVWILRNCPTPVDHQIISVGTRDRKNGLYKFRPPQSNNSRSLLSINSVEVTPKEALASLWHARFCHISPKTLTYMAAKAKVEGLPTLIYKIPFCVACCTGKQSRAPKPSTQSSRRSDHGIGSLVQVPVGSGSHQSGTGSSRTVAPLELLHSDICGPLSKSLSGSRYILSIIDDFSRFTWIFFLKRKSETLTKIKQFKAMIELQSPYRVQAIRSDNGGEYISHEFVRFCNDSGIARQLTQTYTPHQNGVAERKNRTLLDKARCMAFASKTPPYLWTEAIATANYVANRTSTRANSGTTPFERFTGKIPQIDHLRVFGCKSYVLDTSPHLKKWAPRAHECIFLGYDSNSRGFRNFNRATRRILVSKDVRFDELSFPCATPSSSQSSILTSRDWELPILADDPTPVSSEVSPPPSTLRNTGPRLCVSPPLQSGSSTPVHRLEVSVPEDQVPDALPHGDLINPSPSPVLIPSEESLPAAAAHSPSSVPLQTYHRRPEAVSAPVSGASTVDPFLITTRSGRAARPSTRLTDYHLHLTEAVPSVSLPESVAAALLHPGWKAAMECELHSIAKNDTWDMVPLPSDRKAISTKWVFRVKTNPDGSIAKLKARLVARGFQQKEGMDYTETFAPVVKWNTLRSVVALAGHHGWELYHLDVKTAFLNGTIDEDIYVEQPPGFTSPHSTLVCKLKKALYGLKQAPRAWYTKMDTYLSSQGLHKSSADSNLYYLKEAGKITLLLLYVDDVYITGSNTPHIALLRSEIQQAFDMTDLGLLSYSLGIEFLSRPDGIFITQRQYIRETLKEFGLDQCKPAATPMMEKLKLVPDMQAPAADSSLYQRMVGKLIFLTHTRPDIAYAVSVISRFMAHPQLPHAQAVKHLYRYLQGTTDLALAYRKGEENDLLGFTDADWAADAHDRKSTTGFVFFLGSTPVTWNSRKQPTVALSSTESEYMALTEGAKEAVWLRRLLCELNIQDMHTPTIIFGDNQGSLNLARNPVYHGRTKHIEVRHHFVREKILSGEICLDYVPTTRQIADILTKATGRTVFETLRAQLGLVQIDPR